MEITIRKASYEDLAAILSLVKELAAYEKAPEEVWASIQDYQEGFEAGDFEALVVEVHEKIVGTALYYISWSTWKGRMMYLEDFIVKEIYRRFGVGQKLFEAFLTEAKTTKCRLVKWQVLDWNTDAIKFYEKNGAIIEKDWWNGKIIFQNPC